MTISESFNELLTHINPLESELQKVQDHANSIKIRLSTNFNVKKFEIVGSHPRKTAIRKYSDADFFVVFSRDDFRWGGQYKNSNTVLNNIRDDLIIRFPQTNVIRDLQAVIVNFGQGEYSVDVVPAMFWETHKSNWPIYRIPDGVSGWILTSPGIHNKYISDADERSRGKLIYISQLAKFWRECRSPRIPISSFYIDLFLAKHNICVGNKSYQRCLAELFELLMNIECKSFKDPLMISDNISATKTESQHKAAYQSIVYACEHSRKAIEAERKGFLQEARKQWDIIFNGNFPQ